MKRISAFIITCAITCAVVSGVALSVVNSPESVFAYTSPGKPTGFVNDFAGILTQEQINSLETSATSLRDATGFEVAIVTVDTLGDETIETYAVKLFEEWGIGDADQDTGVLLLTAINERSVRIETGYGAEGAVTDIQSGNIIRNVIVPEFQKGDYYTGINNAFIALGQIITKSPEAEKYSVTGAGNGAGSGAKSSEFDYGVVFFVVVIVINILARILGKTKSWWLGGVIGAIVGAIIGLIFGFVVIGIVAIILLTILGLVFDFLVSKHGGIGKGDGPGGFWFFPGGHGGLGGGGGFGGFGGGMSGGGGASGRW